MIARIARPVRAVLLLPVALALAGFAPASHAKPHPAPPTPAYNPPRSEKSPFSHADAFCQPDDNQFETVSSTDPQLRSLPVEVVWLTVGGTNGAPSEDADIDAFAHLVEQCGGIGGRPIDFHVVRTTGDPGTDCANAVDRFHPVIVVSSTLPSAWSCIVRDRRTVLLTGSEVSNADLTGAGGRLVAAGSSEGVERARLLALVDSGRLGERQVAIVAGSDPGGTAFRKDALAVLATKRIRPVALADADAVLVGNLDLGTLTQLQAMTAATRTRPLDVYSFGAADASLPTALEAQPAATERMLRIVRLYAFSSVADPMYRASQDPNTFTDMCNRAIVDGAKRAGATTTTSEPKPPLGASYLVTADVCLLSRIVARGLFAAGPILDQRLLITALHRLPYIDQPTSSGTPKPRPNQVVNEPVRRIEQTIVLDQLQSTCPSAASDTTTTTTVGPAVLCWMPASGWGGGGVVVNVPLPTAPVVVRR